jgi:AraC family transcriptional regulator
MHLSTMPATGAHAAAPGGFVGREPQFTASANAAVVKLLRDGLDAIEDDRTAAAACIRRAYALLEAGRERPDAASPEVIRGGLAPWQIRRVVAFIDANLEHPLSISDLSPAARLSAHYFSRSFKQSFGVTPHAYLYRRRMERAQQLMLTTDEPLCQIAVACGFADQAHFTRRFRQSTGETPHAWRRTQLGSDRAASSIH